jgi:hypothetical protein
VVHGCHAGAKVSGLVEVGKFLKMEAAAEREGERSGEARVRLTQQVV